MAPIALERPAMMREIIECCSNCSENRFETTSISVTLNAMRKRQVSMRNVAEPTMNHRAALNFRTLLITFKLGSHTKG